MEIHDKCKAKQYATWRLFRSKATVKIAAFKAGGYYQFLRPLQVLLGNISRYNLTVTFLFYVLFLLFVKWLSINSIEYHN